MSENEEKGFVKKIPAVNFIKLVSMSMEKRPEKLECSSLQGSQPSLIFLSKVRRPGPV